MAVMTRLEALPQDMLGEITRVNSITSCKELHISSDDYRVSKQLNLSPRKGHPC